MVKSNDWGTDVHRNRGVGESSLDRLPRQAMDEKMQEKYHGNEKIDAVMLRSGNGTQNEEGVGLKSFPIPKLRMLLLVCKHVRRC